MEKSVEFYQTCIKTLLTEYLSLSTDDMPISLSFDDERMCYLVIRVGWLQRYTRIHRCLIHLEIADDTIIIQANNTEDELIPELVRMGIPRRAIRNGAVPDDFWAYAEHQEPQTQQRDQQTMTRSMPTEQLQESIPPLASHA